MDPVLDSSELKAYFPGLSRSRKDTYDCIYQCVDTDFIYDVGDDVWEFLKANGLMHWHRVWDCDDYAHTFSVFARARYFKLHKEDPKMYPADAPAVGALSYRVMNKFGARHRINFFIDTKQELCFLEPQHIMDPSKGAGIVSLNAAEWLSVYRIAA